VQLRYEALPYYVVATVGPLDPSFNQPIVTATIPDLNTSIIYSLRVRVKTSVGLSGWSKGIAGTVTSCSNVCIHGTCDYLFPVSACRCSQGWSGSACDAPAISGSFVESDYTFFAMINEETDFKMWWNVLDDLNAVEIVIQGAYYFYH